ncbi:hypothetical protein FRACYDRAFT_244337 [Fragilariopsis cylindrus CCMP1102]|uniref:Uncharacterized protein n=1 Tax=Fragilariopsis cylindrus CCMP1102 TaxID=635003 RepID=A0A1E7F1T5_9STRA|nr:hypothetical protein FRACYDRAFT_244337 [Fragilariopsis cylindrus CCMP1102]|eukprot:OEU12087.1 hypothetical protein FRACYDRAFT_244337 [Fragilariopsis cylindrus CCMP1102]
MHSGITTKKKGRRKAAKVKAAATAAVGRTHTASKDYRVRALFKSAGLADVEDLEAMRFHHEQMHRMLKTTNASKKRSSGTDDVRSYEQTLYSALAESPVSSNRGIKVPSLACRMRLFPDIPDMTLYNSMTRGKIHRKKMRENTGTIFGRVLKRLGRTKVTAGVFRLDVIRISALCDNLRTDACYTGLVNTRYAVKYQQSGGFLASTEALLS